MANNEEIIADILIKYGKGEQLTKEDSALVDKLCETSEENLLVRELVRDQPWLDEDKQDPQSVPSKELWNQLKKYADRSKKVRPGSKAANRLRGKLLWILVIFAIAAVAVGLRLYNKSTEIKESFVQETDVLPGTGNTGRSILSGGDGSLIAVDTMANGSQIGLGDSSSIKKIDKHSYQLCGLKSGQTGMSYSLKVGSNLKFINLLYPDESRVTLELNAMYSWSSYRNPAHPDNMEGKVRFAIARNTSSPWAVRLPDGSIIEDLSTCFEIDAPVARAPKVSLVGGAIRIKASKASVVLRPKQQAIIQNGQPVISPLAVDTALWIWAGEPLTFNFKNTSLDQTVNTIAHYYRADVSNPNHIPGIHVTAKIPASKGLDFLCKRITEIQSSTAYLRMSEDSIYITDRKM